MQALTPMSREAMRGLKAKVEEENRLKRLRTIIDHIYRTVFSAAMTKIDTSFNFTVPFDMSPQPKTKGVAQQGRPSDPFYIENMADILSGLQLLFPDCTVSHSILSQGTDGKLYDISTMHEKTLLFVNRALDQSFIVIDWS